MKSAFLFMSLFMLSGSWVASATGGPSCFGGLFGCFYGKPRPHQHHSRHSAYGVDAYVADAYGVDGFTPSPLPAVNGPGFQTQSSFEVKRPGSPKAKQSTKVVGLTMEDARKEFLTWINEFERRSSQITWAENSRGAMKRLMKDMRAVDANQKATPRKELEYIVYVDPNNIYHWFVKFINLDINYRNHPFTNQVNRDANGRIIVEMVFPPSYPNDPPFVRVVTPELQQWTGHLMQYGAMCAPFLVSGGGWNKEIHITALLALIVGTLYEPKGDGMAKISRAPRGYTFGLAYSSYTAAIKNRHQEWKVPAGFGNSIARLN